VFKFRIVDPEDRFFRTTSIARTPQSKSGYAIPQSGTGSTYLTPPGCPWLAGVVPEPVGDLTGALLHGRDAGEGV